MPSEAISDVKLAQRACTRAGMEPISSFSDGTAEAIVLNDNYDAVVDDALASFPWPFALKEVALDEVAETPPQGYDTVYQLPAEALQVQEVLINGTPHSWEIIGDKVVVAASGDANGRYTYRVDESKWHPVFSEYIVMKLAAMLASGVAHDGNRAQYFENQALRYYRRARFVNAAGRTPRRLVASRLTGYR